NVVSSEAEHERLAHLSVVPETLPKKRTLLRLRDDLVMIGRAVTIPLPKAFRIRLDSSLTATGIAFADCLRATGVALRASGGPPSLNAVEAALAAYAAEI